MLFISKKYLCKMREEKKEERNFLHINIVNINIIQKTQNRNLVKKK